MNKERWEFNETGEASLENDANDYYYEWVSLSAGEMSIDELFEKFLGLSYGSKPIRVKARKGAIFIVLNGDKDDTENPNDRP